MKKIFLIVILFLILIFNGCNLNIESSSKVISGNYKPMILTSFFPVYDITKNLVGNDFDVEVLIPIGVDPHSFQMSPKEVVKYSNLDSFVEMGGMFDIYENKFLNSFNDKKKVYLINSTENLNYSKYYSNVNKNNINPHIWLSFDFMSQMTKNIASDLIKKYPNKKGQIESGEKRYLEKLKKLKSDYKKGLSNCKYNKIIVNHKAYTYLAKDYNFTQISVAGFSPESEPSPNTIKMVVDTAKSLGLKYVFVEENLDKKVSETIANDIGGEVIELSPISIDENVGYFELMEDNLNNLKIGLNCK